MKNLLISIRKELVLKLDFVKWEFEIGWIWVILEIPSLYLMVRNWIIFLFS